MTIPDQSPPNEAERPAFLYGMTALFFGAAGGLLGKLALNSETMDPSATSGDNVIRGAVAVALASGAAYEAHNFIKTLRT
jgi:hypothetical protein